MQNSNTSPGRTPSTTGINSKISVPAGAEGKGLGLGSDQPMGERGNDAPVKPGAAGGAIKGFGGGLINPKIGT